MTLQEIARKAALLPRPAVFPPRLDSPPPVTVRTVWGNRWCSWLQVGSNRWRTGIFPRADFDLACLWADFCQHHFAPWRPVPRFHFQSLPELPPEWPELARTLEAVLNSEHDLGNPGLCLREHTVHPWCVYTRPRREVLRVTENLSEAFTAFRQSASKRSAAMQSSLEQLVAQQSAILDTQQQLKTYLSQVASLREIEDTARLLKVLSTVPCNSRGLIDRRSAAQQLGATPEQLDQLFPLPPPPLPPEPPAWLPAVKAALIEASQHLFSLQDASRCRSLARAALDQIVSEAERTL